MMSLGSQDLWERIDIKIDSGAACNALPEDVAAHFPLTPVEGRTTYTSASNGTMEAAGMRMPMLHFLNGSSGPVKFKVLPGLKKPLISVDRLLEAGYVLNMSKDNCRATNARTGHSFKIFRRNGVTVIPTWVRRPSFTTRKEEKVVGFVGASPQEKRVDPADGVAYTWEDFSTYYKAEYEKAEIAEYWETCKPAKGPSKTADFRRQAVGL